MQMSASYDKRAMEPLDVTDNTLIHELICHVSRLFRYRRPPNPTFEARK